jgi:hypothetical protein
MRSSGNGLSNIEHSPQASTRRKRRCANAASQWTSAAIARSGPNCMVMQDTEKQIQALGGILTADPLIWQPQSSLPTYLDHVYNNAHPLRSSYVNFTHKLNRTSTLLCARRLATVRDVDTKECLGVLRLRTRYRCAPAGSCPLFLQCAHGTFCFSFFFPSLLFTVRSYMYHRLRSVSPSSSESHSKAQKLS